MQIARRQKRTRSGPMYVVHRGNVPISEHATYEEAKQKADQLNRLMAAYAQDERAKPYHLKLKPSPWFAEAQRKPERV
jgi:hypothetical protein